MKLTSEELSKLCSSVESCAECRTEVHQACAEWKRCLRQAEPWEWEKIKTGRFGVGNEKIEAEPKGD